MVIRVQQCDTVSKELSSQFDLQAGEDKYQLIVIFTISLPSIQLGLYILY